MRTNFYPYDLSDLHHSYAMEVKTARRILTSPTLPIARFRFYSRLHSLVRVSNLLAPFLFIKRNLRAHTASSPNLIRHG